MKREYEAPMLEVEAYMLDTSIAANCSIKVHNGPAEGSHKLCNDYTDPFAGGEDDEAQGASLYNVTFYEDTNCDCYYTGGKEGYWTS